MGQDERCGRQKEEQEKSKVENPRCNIGTWGTWRFLETLGRLGITHRRTAYHHPEGNGYIERLHRSLKEEEVWTAEYRSLEEARESIARWIEEYNHDRPQRSLGDRTPREVFVGFGSGLRTEALSVRI